MTDYGEGRPAGRLETVLGWVVVVLITAGTLGLALLLGWLTVTALEWLLSATQ